MGGWPSIISEGKANHESYIWRGLQFSTSWFRRGLTWNIKDGKSILFWLEPWLMAQSLVEVAIQPILGSQLKATVSNYWCARQGWKLEELWSSLSPHILQKLTMIWISDGVGQDHPIWSLNESGIFSTCSIRKLSPFNNQNLTTICGREFGNYVAPHECPWHFGLLCMDHYRQLNSFGRDAL